MPIALCVSFKNPVMICGDKASMPYNRTPSDQVQGARCETQESAQANPGPLKGKDATCE